MKATNIIRDAVTSVALLRQSTIANPALAQAMSDIKQFQSRRFSGTYIDLLESDRYKPAVLFFLAELYNDKDYSERDTQFARIAGALERIFPVPVVQTAVSLAQLHRLTEDLDLAMAQHWLSSANSPEVTRYVMAWRAVARRTDRNTQLATVMEIGHELGRLTRTPGPHLMLKMMRGPANLAGMGSLHRFLESGFDTFATMACQDGGVANFLSTVMARETGLIDRLFDASAVACETEISQLLGQAR